MENARKFIGNVVVSSPNMTVDECYKKCISYSEIDESVPTIIIGLENARNTISDFNILKNKYNDNMLWWTCSKTERRVDYDRNLEDFYKFCIYNIINNINYKLIDLISLKFTRYKNAIEYIKNNNKKYYYIHNDKFIFVNEEDNYKNIIGISLNTCAFFGIKKKKIIDLIDSNPSNKRIKNFYNLPKNIRLMVNDDIPSQMILSRYFIER